MQIQNNNFNLVLSGGGALGFAHMGVLEYLNENVLEPKSLHGVSMGAIVASVYALDLDFEKKMALFDEFFGIMKWLKISFGKGSVVSSDKIYKILDDVFKEMRFSDLSKELHIIATNYDTGDATFFNTNNNIKIKDAVIASMSIPSLFTPVKIDENYYVDGYLSENLPLSTISNTLPNLLVNVTGSQSFKHLSDDAAKDISVVGNLERSVRILMCNQAKTALRTFSKPYLLLEPNVADFKTSHFHKMQEIKQVGYDEAKAKINV